ncbi:MAG: TldD/PmbA family protein [Defluviitaleaceae bacterium]|nr:TldD/PmbA family protein [Defluviitaleaceae bacterium]
MLQNLLSPYKGSFKDYTELRAQVNTNQRVVLVAGNMVSNSQETEGGVSARVYRGGTFGFASGATYTPEGVKNVLSAATDNAIFMDSHAKKGQPPLPSAAPGNQGLVIQPRPAVQQSILIDFAKAVDALIVEKYKNLSSRTVVSNSLDIEKLLVISDGADSHFYQPRSMVYVMMTADTPDGIPVEMYVPLGGFGHFDELFMSPAQYEAEIDALYESLMKKREGVFTKAGYTQCVLGPKMAGMLAHEAIGHTVEADAVISGSVASYNLNKQVASELVTMIDIANTYQGRTIGLPVYVDDEGVIAEDAMLIDKGILTGYMHNRDSARELGMKPQGNARAFTFSDEPLIRMRNTAILPGTSKLEDMIASVEDGYYLVDTGNGQADQTGEFMFSVEEGYEIKNGKLGKAIRETTVSGVAFEMLKTVDMVADDMYWTVSGFCGKKQPMTCGMGGPALRCMINVGGK